MGLTASGKRKKDAIAKLASGEVLAELILKEMQGLPSVIVARVKEDGAGADKIGGSLKDFSTPYSKKWGKKRSDKGLPTDKKNFYFDGGMTGNFSLKDYSLSRDVLSFTFGMTDSKESAKENGHSKREGVESIFLPSKDDVDKVMENVREALDKYLKNAFK